MGYYGAERGAPLAGGAEAGEEGALDGEIQVRVWHDDQRVLAAELQARRLQVPPAELADLLADLRGSREAYLVDEALLERLLEALEGGRPLGLDYVEDPVGEAAVDKELGEGVADGGGVLCRLPDDGVAAG